jgi:hypothetical protein
MKALAVEALREIKAAELSDDDFEDNEVGIN